MNKLKELYSYRQMLKSLISSDLRTRYKGSVLGFLWTFINPLLLLVVYTLIFSTIMKVDIKHYSMYLFVGLLPWTFFQTTLLGSTSVIVRNANLVKKIYFPREVLPLSTVIGGLVNYLLSLFILIPALYFSGIPLTSSIIYFPFILIIQTVLVTGFSVLFSALNVYFRDLEHILGIITMVWFYMTPIIFPASQIPTKFQPYFNINPLKPIIEAYQNIFFYHKAPDLSTLGITVIFAVILLFFSFFIFNKLNKRFAEEV